MAKEYVVIGCRRPHRQEQTGVCYKTVASYTRWLQWGCCLLCQMVVMGLSSVIPDGYNAMGLLSVIRNGCNGIVVCYTRWWQWGCRLLYQVVATVLSSLSKMDKMVLSSVIPDGCCDTVGGHVFCNYS